MWEGTHQIVNSGALAGVAQLVGASSRKPKGCGVLFPVGAPGLQFRPLDQRRHAQP